MITPYCETESFYNNKIIVILLCELKPKRISFREMQFISMDENTAKIGLIVCVIFLLVFGVNLLNGYNALQSQKAMKEAVFGGNNICNPNSYSYDSDSCSAFKAKFGDPLAVDYSPLIMPGLLFLLSLIGAAYCYKESR